MDNTIYKNKENMEFIENNMEELSKSIDTEEYISKYYIGAFKDPKCGFNTGAGYYQSMWYGYRKMYLESFLIGIISTLIIILIILMALAIGSKGSIDELARIHSIYTNDPVSWYLKVMNGYFVLGWILAYILIYGYIYLLGKYGNYIYFKSLKKRIISKNKKKYGKSKLGILYGTLLGALGSILAICILGVVIGLVVILSSN